MPTINQVTTRFTLKAIGVIGAIIFIISCAQQRPLTGGEKDTTPPKIKSSSPQNFSKNYTGNTIAFEFDEYIQVQGLSSELVVSPPLNKTPKYSILGKKLYLTIEDTLLPNTTYNFNFGEAIVDLNENNPLDSNLFVFSTGNSIDSGSISGKVIESFTGKPMKGATVMLFSTLQDSITTAGNPMYVTKTDGSGNFSLNFLKDMDYEILAAEFTGQNFSLVPFENAAFYPTTVHSHHHEPLELYAFKEQDTTQYISKEKTTDYYSFILAYHCPLVNPSFTFNPQSDSFDYYIEEIEPDSFKFWLSNDLEIDSVTLFVKDGLGVNDTVTYDLPSRSNYYRKLLKKKKKIAKTSIKLNSTTHHYFDTLYLNYSRPIQSYQTDSMYLCLEEDTTSFTDLINQGKLKLLINQDKIGTSKELKRTAVIYDWQPKSTYGIIFHPGAITDILNLTNDTTILNAKTKEFEDYGSFRLNVNVEDYTKPIIIELLDEKGKPFKTFYSNTGSFKVHEPLFVPGKFQIRLTLDENGNKIWDTGSILKKILPEKTIYFSGTVEVRPNWDMEETWNITLE